MIVEDLKQALDDGDLERAASLAIERVKNEPAEPGNRSMLFQLSAVLGDWDRAEKQLDMVGTLDAAALDFVQDYKAAIAAEHVRLKVISGKQSPSVMGEPPAWIAPMVEALRLDDKGEAAAAFDLRSSAMETATAVPGIVNDMAFDWIADADQRFGPVIECILNGEYHWIPVENIAELAFEAPRDLRDLVWSVGIVTFSNGGSWPIMIPTRYPCSDYRLSRNSAHALSRHTGWTVLHESHMMGIGQRMLATDTDDISLLDIRSLKLNLSNGTPEPSHHL